MSNTATLDFVDNYTQPQASRVGPSNLKWINAAFVGLSILSSTSTCAAEPTLMSNTFVTDSSFLSNTTLDQAVNQEVATVERNREDTDGAPRDEQRGFWVAESEKLFSGSREFTLEEAEKYEESLNKLFTPTGRNLFDL